MFAMLLLTLREQNNAVTLKNRQGLSESRKSGRVCQDSLRPPGMADPLASGATCGVTFIDSGPFTKFWVSLPFSAGAVRNGVFQQPANGVPAGAFTNRCYRAGAIIEREPNEVLIHE